jgi:MoaA/NifB/PqqE/SkfB family radical SAM enzyme
MSSKYWDDFERRIRETCDCVRSNKKIPVRRVAVFITNKCNFKCEYCNVSQNKSELSLKQFDRIVKRYQDSIIHITGGEPSTVKWLYNYIDSCPGVHFNLNTNAHIRPPENIQRLKVSLDSCNGSYFNSLVHRKDAFDKVINNIKLASKRVVTSITCTLTKENYKESPRFMRWCRDNFPDLYAVFFSVYKGTNEKFMFDSDSANDFFDNIKPKLENEMDAESLNLLTETIDEKVRVIHGVRFPENNLHIPCFISMSERVFDSNGDKFNCSHLFRDSIFQKDNKKHSKCLYGCNRRLVLFNEEVYSQLQKKSEEGL